MECVYSQDSKLNITFEHMIKVKINYTYKVRVLTPYSRVYKVDQKKSVNCFSISIHYAMKNLFMI